MKYNGLNCPKCGGYFDFLGRLEDHCGEIFQDIQCEDCGALFTDVYELAKCIEYNAVGIEVNEHLVDDASNDAMNKLRKRNL